MADEEKRTKRTKLRKVERKHNGRITPQYAILERLIAELPEFHHLKVATFIVMKNSGWTTSRDGLLKHASISLATERERELHGDFDLCLSVNRQLWESSRYTEEQREQDIYHELLHVVADVDKDSGEQRKDDRGRLCWRLRDHPIQRFPEEIERYGIEKVLKLDLDAKAASADEQSQASAKATENDANRPLLATSDMQLAKMGIEQLQERTEAGNKISDRTVQMLVNAGIENVLELKQRIVRNPEFWYRDVKGVGKDTRTPIEDALNEVVAAGIQSDK